MIYIQLTKGIITAIDDWRLEELNAHKWHASGLDNRPARRLKDYEHDGTRRMIFLYHQVLGVWPWELREKGLVVDHIDRDPLNNQQANLRLVPYAINMRNTIRSEVKQGVAFDSRHSKWKAYLDRPGLPRINIGTFLTKEEAELALANKKKELLHANT